MNDKAIIFIFGAVWGVVCWLMLGDLARDFAKRLVRRKRGDGER